MQTMQPGSLNATTAKTPSIQSAQTKNQEKEKGYRSVGSPPMLAWYAVCKKKKHLGDCKAQQSNNALRSIDRSTVGVLVEPSRVEWLKWLATQAEKKESC